MSGQQWAATEMPRMRRDLVHLLGVLDAAPAAGMAAAAATAELYWVTRDMTVVAYDASADIPEWTPAAVIPSPTGMLIWSCELPSLPGRIWATGPAPVSGVVWSQHAGRLHVWVLARTVDIDIEAETLAAVVGDEVPDAVIPWCQVDPVDAAGSIGADPDGEAAGLLALLGATWILMDLPTVGRPRTVTGAGGSARGWTREERQVRVVDLRRIVDRGPAHDPDEESGVPGREYRHRWMVRGHWRQQAVGPGRAQRRPTWVAPYTKGPDGAPLLTGEHVMVWRR